MSVRNEMSCNFTGCRAIPNKTTGWCFFHNPDPEAANKRERGREEGGRNSRQQAPPARTMGEDAPDLRLETKADFLTLMAYTINQVRRGQLGCEVGRTIGYLAGVGLKALDEGTSDERLAKLEEQVKVLRSAPLSDLLAAATGAAAIDAKPNH